MGLPLFMVMVAAVWYAACSVRRAVAGASTPRPAETEAEQRQALAAARREQSRAQQARRRTMLARRFQAALLQVGLAPDFRRAASCARQARDVPAAFRQRQFRRFRPKLVHHFAARWAVGADPEHLTETLTQLVQALGVAAFEADYIRAEAAAARQTPTPRSEPTYAERLETLRRQHADRLAALRSLPGVEDETREQLIEAETTRFREELLQLGQVAQPPT